MPSCFGGNNGAINLTVTGGTPVYTYLWSTSDTIDDISSLTAGSYTCTISDANGCLDSLTITLGQPDSLVVTANLTDESCAGTTDGAVGLSVSGGTPAYTYAWDTGAAVDTVNGLTSGPVGCTVSDANGCTSVQTFTIGSLPPVVATTSNDTTICIGQSTELLAAGIGGAGAPFTYSWDQGLPADSNPTATPTVFTCYNVTVADAAGCTATNAVCVDVNPSLSVLAIIDQTICNGQSATINATVTGGNGGPYSFAWNNGATSNAQTVTPNSYPNSTDYIVTVSDGCSPDVADTVTISFHPNPDVSFVAIDSIGCAPHTVVFNSTSVAGVSCVWEVEPGINIVNCDTFSYTYTSEGLYAIQLLVASANGCVDSLGTTLEVGTQPTAEYEVQLFPSCDGIMAEFIGTTANAERYEWTFNQSKTDTSETAEYLFAYGAGMEAVLIADNGFCADTATFSQTAGQFADEFPFEVPNIFTPNGDGVNDFFEINFENRYQQCSQLDVYTRWGERVYSSLGAQHSWDGRKFTGDLANEGTYFYVFTVGELEFKGTLMLSR